MAWNDELIGDDDLDELLRADRAGRAVASRTAELLRDPHRGRVPLVRRLAVDVAVVEVGLGGTWDATNVVDAPVAVVTNVAIDHVEYLGTTREQIAAEKAGIVKRGATLVLGETDPDLEAYLPRARARARVAARSRLRGARAIARARRARRRPLEPGR